MGSLATVWRSLTLTWPPVHLSSESERTLALWHFRAEVANRKLSFQSPVQRLCFTESAEESQVCRWRRCPSSHCQSGWGWSCYNSRNLHTALQSSRASSAVWGSPAGTEPQHATRLSSNSIWIIWIPQCRSGLHWTSKEAKWSHNTLD